MDGGVEEGGLRGQGVWADVAAVEVEDLGSGEEFEGEGGMGYRFGCHEK